MDGVPNQINTPVSRRHFGRSVDHCGFRNSAASDESFLICFKCLKIHPAAVPHRTASAGNMQKKSHRNASSKFAKASAEKTTSWPAIRLYFAYIGMLTVTNNMSITAVTAKPQPVHFISVFGVNLDISKPMFGIERQFATKQKPERLCFTRKRCRPASRLCASALKALSDYSLDFVS